jgi:hypothetical protein
MRSLINAVPQYIFSALADAPPKAEGVELSDRRCCEKLVARGRVLMTVLMTYVMQRDVAHVLPLRLSPRRFCVADVLPPYFAIAARMTAKLRTNPLITMNFLDRS